MYLKITMQARNKKEIRLPLQYNYYLQGLIYKLLEGDLARFLHEKGFQLEKRQFKMFCFSQLIGNYKIALGKKEIIFENQVVLYISSPMEIFLRQLSNSFLLNQNIFIGDQCLEVQNICIEKSPEIEDKVVVQTLSPVTAYSTLYKAEGSKYTCYFHPKDKEFQELITANLCKKYQAFYGQEVEDSFFIIHPLGKIRQHVVNYKGIFIKGYSGKFLLCGNKQLITMALESGIGSKNSQGFGCVQIAKSDGKKDFHII
ncbi:CRISPR-associated endoribonuclease Cas6 [Thermotalea metallivorans]|uniref:CRISPR-associated endoribonuclease n=1 Tax=Thermotalea metallivorans TaxID=520762 RepID=A0A140L1D4_9FIRM|nr:CRISPR-associated endoribonuclease Cas6 [Thermotalea metallivorans]KXG74359.1 hypothetical protein AN619_24100 [Thermotalea metallivorans]